MLRAGRPLGLALCAAALTVTATAPTVAAAHAAAASVGNPADRITPARSCLDNEGPDGGQGQNSENFEGQAEASDAAAADFKVPTKCVITVVTAHGYFLYGSQPADSFSLLVYANDNSAAAPGAVVAEQDNLAYSYDEASHRLVIHPDRIVLRTGKYWLSIVANMNYQTEGLWQWEQSYTKTGRPDMWENPGGGQGVECTNWGTLRRCLSAYPGNLMVVAGSGGANS